MLLALVVAGSVLASFPALPFFVLWFVLRFLHGMASEMLFVLSEAWTNSLNREKTRACVMVAYTGVLYVGFAGSPSIPSVIGTSGNLPYLVGASLALVAIFLVAIPKVAAPDFAEAAMGSPLRFLHLAPVAIAATTLNAALETSGLSFLVGAIALQLPIGWFGDKWDRVRLVVCLAAAAAFVTVMGTKGGFL